MAYKITIQVEGTIDDSLVKPDTTIAIKNAVKAISADAIVIVSYQKTE